MSKSCSQEIACDIFECHLDRAEAGMPDYFIPEAPGVLLAGKDMLIAVGNVPEAPEPAGWTPGVPLIPDHPRAWEAADFEKPSADGDRMLRVKRFGKFWMPERSIRVSWSRGQLRQVQSLVFAFGNAPIWTRDRQAAMRLAEYCDPIPTSPVAGLWLPRFTCSFHRPIPRSRARRHARVPTVA
jgi:hypothetical protein